MPRIAVRDVDALDALPDEKLKQQDAAYLEKHGIDKIFNDVLANMVQLKPQDPIQYIIDYVAFGPEHAAQDPKTGLPENRKGKLLDVFRLVDKEGRGKVSLATMQGYTSKYGGRTLSDTELKSMFNDFHPGQDHFITQHEWLVFFAKVSHSITNQQFEDLVKHLSS